MKALLVVFALTLALLCWMAPARVDIGGPRPLDLDNMPVVGATAQSL